jgi:hypothetical protein
MRILLNDRGKQPTLEKHTKHGVHSMRSGGYNKLRSFLCLGFEHLWRDPDFEAQVASHLVKSKTVTTPSGAVREVFAVWGAWFGIWGFGFEGWACAGRLTYLHRARVIPSMFPRFRMWVLAGKARSFSPPVSGLERAWKTKTTFSRAP